MQSIFDTVDASFYKYVVKQKSSWHTLTGSIFSYTKKSRFRRDWEYYSKNRHFVKFLECFLGTNSAFSRLFDVRRMVYFLV